MLLDENGRYVRGELFGLFVMRKEAGFGAKYGPLRNYVQLFLCHPPANDRHRRGHRRIAAAGWAFAHG